MEKQNLIASPSVNFNNVEELLLCEELSTDEKIVALENWKSAWLQECISMDEGMIEHPEVPPEETSPIEDISDALRCLKKCS